MSDLLCDGYPTDIALDLIRTWDFSLGFDKLLGFVQDLWWPQEGKWPGFQDPVETEEKALFYAMSTGGWSGNESIIGALKDNTMFWMFCWYKSQRGGYYEFEVGQVNRKEGK